MKHHHVCIITSDAKKLMAWYEDKFGFEIIRTWTVDLMPGLNLNYIARDGVQIEIIGDIPKPDATEEKGNPLENITNGYNHFAISVEDIEATLKDLEQKDVESLIPVQQIPQAGIIAAIIQDLDGNLIELIQALD
ncbi:MAG: VOC family protein [Chloroflexota bacterium]